MRVVPVGVGQTGRKVTDRLLEYQSLTDREFVETAFLVDSSMRSLMAAEEVPPEHRVVVGQARADRAGDQRHAVGAEVVSDDVDALEGTIGGADLDGADAFLVVAETRHGLAGDAAPVVARTLGELSSKPVVGLVVVPPESRGGAPTGDREGSLQALDAEVDQLLLVEPDSMGTGDGNGGAESSPVAEEVARRLGLVLGRDPDDGDVDRSGDTAKILETLSGGTVSSMGYASEQVATSATLRLVGRLTGIDESVVDANQLSEQLLDLVERAAVESWSPFDGRGDPDRATLVVAGPPAVPRMAIEQGRGWLESELTDVDVPLVRHSVPGANVIACVVVCSGPPRREYLTGTEDDGSSERPREAGLAND